MPRSFRESRFRGRGEMGEDINPSAYIVNLADCMLVLAVGFAVALIARWNIPLNDVTAIDENDMTQIDAETLPEDITASGSYYQEVGTAYVDPNTGTTYIVKPVDGDDGSADGSSSGSSTGASGAGGSSSGGTSASGGSTKSDTDIANARALGAD